MHFSDRRRGPAFPIRPGRATTRPLPVMPIRTDGRTASLKWQVDSAARTRLAPHMPTFPSALFPSLPPAITMNADTQSLWALTNPARSATPLAGDVSCDVCVVGGGIAD